MLLARLQYPTADFSQPWRVRLRASSAGWVPENTRSLGALVHWRAAAPFGDPSTAGLKSYELLSWSVSGLLKAAKLRELPKNWELEAFVKSRPVTWQAELPCCMVRAGCTAEALRRVSFSISHGLFLCHNQRWTDRLYLVFCFLGWLFVVPRRVILSSHWGLLLSSVSPAAFAASGQGAGAEVAASCGLRDYFRAISSFTHFSSLILSKDSSGGRGSASACSWLYFPWQTVDVGLLAPPVEFGLARAFCTRRLSLCWNLFISLACWRPDSEVLSCHGLWETIDTLSTLSLRPIKVGLIWEWYLWVILWCFMDEGACVLCVM